LEAAYRAIDLLVETTGGAVVGPVYRVGGDVPWQREVVVTHGYICEKLGFEIPAAEMRASLEALELNITREELTGDRGPAWCVAIPSWRDDLDRPIDLVEEVLRLFGTDKVPSAVVTAPGLVNDDDPVVLFNRRVTDYLVGHDFHECVSYTLRSAREISTWVSQTAAVELALANPFVDDQSHLRPTLVMGLLESLKLNQSRGVAAARLCETGRVFIERNGRNYECAAAGFIMTEPPGERAWLGREPADFYAVKQHVAALAAAAGLDLARQPLVPVTGAYYGWQEGQSAAAGEMAQGWTARFGLLNLAMVQSLGIEGKVYAGIFAILPEKLTADGARRRFAEFSLMPAALRDLALVVDEAVTADEVRKSLAKFARAAVGNAFALERVEIFDVYRGAGLPEGQKSLAFSLVFRAVDRTLTDAEVNAACLKVQEEVARTTPWLIRK
jgi:phenylalanyl-tRNA synthetase beta chain